MSSARDGPNPLRPYYIPPSIGVPHDVGNTTRTTSQQGLGKNGIPTTYASSARDMFADIDYSDYVSDGSQSTVESIRALLDQGLYKFLSVLLAQPFEVAKTVLQVRSQAGGDGTIPLVDVNDGDARHQTSNYADV